MPPVKPLIALMAAAYFFGAVPWGLLLTRFLVDRDVRALGSGNIGATNVARVAGKRIGLLTLLLDMLKGWLPVFTALHLFPVADPSASAMAASLAALCAIIGHMFSVYLKFKTGGKGVATAAGCFIAISPISCAAGAIVFLLVFFLFRRVSAASLSAIALLPLLVGLWGGSPYFTMAAGIAALLIFIRHAANIRRLINGTEPVFGKDTGSGGPTSA